MDFRKLTRARRLGIFHVGHTPKAIYFSRLLGLFFQISKQASDIFPFVSDKSPATTNLQVPSLDQNHLSIASPA